MTSTERVPPPTCPARLDQRPGLQVLDVRELREWNAGHIPGLGVHPLARHRRYPARASTPTRPIAVICAAGVRAATAASLLERHGADDVIHVIDGGVPALALAGMQLESSPA